MKDTNNVLMLQRSFNSSDAKMDFYRMIERLQKEYSISILKDNDII